MGGRRDLVPVPAEVMEALSTTAAGMGTTMDELVAAALWHYSQLPLAARQAIADHFWLDRAQGAAPADRSHVAGPDGDGMG